jgi:hypothetical protein
MCEKAGPISKLMPYQPSICPSRRGSVRHAPFHRYNPTVATTLYMVIEHFKNGDPAPVYRRFRERGRLAPDGLTYINSWVDVSLERCYQLMETEDRTLLDQWIANWRDIVEFEVHPVITSADAAARVDARS